MLTFPSDSSNSKFPMPETTPVKETAGQVLYEKYAIENELPFVSFRPQVSILLFIFIA